MTIGHTTSGAEEIAKWAMGARIVKRKIWEGGGRFGEGEPDFLPLSPPILLPSPRRGGAGGGVCYKL